MANGNDVYLAKGNFSCTSALQLYHGTFLHGAGHKDYGTVLTFTGCDGLIKKSTEASCIGADIQDMQLYADNDKNVINATLWGRSNLDKLYISGGLIGVLYSGQYFNTLTRSRIIGNLTGVKYTGTANANWIWWCEIRGTATGGDPGSTQVGVFFDSSAGSTLRDCWIGFFGTGIKLGTYAPILRLDHPYFETIAADGYAINLGTAADGGVKIMHPMYDGAFTNRLTGTRGAGFYMDGFNVSNNGSWSDSGGVK